MRRERVLVTGATGMVGSAVVQRLIDIGCRVRALIRPASLRCTLDLRPVERVEGDLDDLESLKRAIDQVDAVVHAAGMVGDWGPPELYWRTNVAGLKNLLAALEWTGGVRRFVHVSSLSVYASREHYGTDESEPVEVDNLDAYACTKARAELVLRQRAAEMRLPFVILRPGFLYGPRDRHAVPRLVTRIRNGRMRLIGDGRKLHNNTYVGNLVDAVMAALERGEAEGEAFNIRDARLVTREEIVGTLADYYTRPYPRRVPEWLARRFVGAIEFVGRVRKCVDPPMLTRRQLQWMTQNLDFSIAKARRVLDYRPQVDFQDGIRRRCCG